MNCVNTTNHYLIKFLSENTNDDCAEIIYKKYHQMEMNDIVNFQMRKELILFAERKQYKAFQNLDQDRMKFWNYYRYYIVGENKNKEPIFNYTE